MRGELPQGPRPVDACLGSAPTGGWSRCTGGKGGLLGAGGGGALGADSFGTPCPRWSDVSMMGMNNMRKVVGYDLHYIRKKYRVSGM